MQKLLITSAIIAITALAAVKATAQSNPPPPQQGTTVAGEARQAALPPLDLMTAIFLNVQASSTAGVPVERDTAVFAPGEQIMIYTKFANVGRTNPGAVDGFMRLASYIRVDNSAGQTVIEQQVPMADFDSVPFPYEGDIPDAYFHSFKLTIFALQTPDDYALTLTFVDETRPTTETAPVVVTMAATIE